MRDDPRFAIENLYKILDLETSALVPFRFNEAQVRLDELRQWFRKHALPTRVVIGKARRAGLSTGVEGFIYQDTTTHPLRHSLIVANQRNPSENVLEMCRRFWFSTPEEFRPPIPREYNNNPPRDRLIFDKPLDSKIFVATAQSIDAYLSFGFQNIHATEVAFFADGYELFRALYPTLTKGPHSALYMESTANGQTGKGEFFYEQVMSAHQNRGRAGDFGVMRLLFIPWHEMKKSFAIPFASDDKKRSFRRTLTTEEIELCQRFSYIELEQLQWRRMMLAGPPYNKMPEKFDQDYPTDLQTMFLSGGWSLFGFKTIKKLMQAVRDPVFVGDVFWGESDEKNEREGIYDLVRRPLLLTKGDSRAIVNGRERFRAHDNDGSRSCLRVYRWPEKGERLFIGGDIGGGSKDTRDGDFSVWQVVSQNPWGPDEQIMTWRGRCSALRFAEIGAALAWKLCSLVGPEVVGPVLAPEYTGPGKSTCVYLDEKHLYEVYRYQAPGVKGLPRSKHVGWESNFNTKPQMVNYLIKAVDEDGLVIRDAGTVLEMSAYRQMAKDDDMAFGGASGVHDDRVSALQIANVLSRWERGTGSFDRAIPMTELDDPEAEPWDPFRQQPAEQSVWDGMNLDGWDEDDAGGALESAMFYAIEP